MESLDIQGFPRYFRLFEFNYDGESLHFPLVYSEKKLENPIICQLTKHMI
ncbi:hypothetical protein HMPREF9081_1499 [Centipeda periodontii DSM 2778]|uniref:Uncharacterized protein n=1 Tax=Centipeda periodontii DSM 2778 TaxID=888060 RepID=F5RML3_9FIRM|nr:hypothetical protein HMPREF9081_1499 [Centipeda periodontii DSM 2778]